MMDFLTIGPFFFIRETGVLKALLFHLYIKLFSLGGFKEFDGSIARDNAKSSAQQ
jgi:hypothetical protein